MTNARKEIDQGTMASNGQLAVKRLLLAFQQHFGVPDNVKLARAPGRVNLIGDHTDYNDGFVLPMTLGQAVYLAIRKRPDQRILLHSLNYNDVFDGSLDALAGKGTSWKHYVSGVIQLLLDRGAPLTGFEGVLYGDVPVGAGLSSSAATEVATLVALQTLFEFELDDIESVKLCRQVEHQFIGVQCGIMDQFVSRMGSAGHALFLDCRTLTYQKIPVSLDDHCFVIADSRTSRFLAGSKYNERRGECEAGVSYFRQYDRQIQALRDVSPVLLEDKGYGLPQNVCNRCRHVVYENARVQQAVDALRTNDLNQFGELMSASHESLRDLYEVSCKELDRLVDIAISTDGVLGARMTGAGFGGCTVAVLQRSAVPSLTARLKAGFRESFGTEPAVYLVDENVEAGPIRT